MSATLDLTEYERRMILEMRRRREIEEREERRRHKRTYPFILRDELGVKVVKPNEGKHSGFWVCVDDELLCLCMYRKGAYSLMDYILKFKKEKEVA